MHHVTLGLLRLFVISVFSPSEAATGKKCSFPVEWRGRYYQTGLKEVIIRENVITTKGTCIEQNNRDYFLFYNRESQCYHCLLIMRQHRNIIQYKESYCTNVANMSVVCNHIRVETTLYTMVKEPVVSGVKCPFQDAFNFTYNDMSSEFCSQMDSYAKPCVSQTHYRLLFRHCTGSAEYHEKEFHLECLATWKDGSEMYLYGRLSGSGLASKDERYRCFKYHQYGSEMSVAMSADTSCRGLRSSTDGPLLMKFSKDSLGTFSASSCRFPDWLAGVTWRSLDGKLRYTLDSDSVTLLESFRSSSGHLQRLNEYKCHEQVVDRRHSDDVILISYTSHKCSSKRQCVRIKRIGNRVIKFFQGPSLEIPSSSDVCRFHFYDKGQLLIPDDLLTSPCPRPGIYAAATSDVCPRRLEVGCHSNTEIHGRDRCQGPLSVSSVECSFSWNEETKTFVITKSKDSETINCFSFNFDDLSNVEWMALDLSCLSNQTAMVDSSVKYFRLQGQSQDSCHNMEKSTRSTLDLDPKWTEKYSLVLPTQNPDRKWNLFADGVQPSGRSKLPALLIEDEEDEDEVFSGVEGSDQYVDRKFQRAPPEQHPVTWKRALPVSTAPTLVFQISSSPRRVNNAKFGTKGHSDDQGQSEGQEGRPNQGQEEVEDYDQIGCCGRPKILLSVIILSMIFSHLKIL